MKKNNISTYIKVFLFSLCSFVFCGTQANAADITAVDFNGNVVGQVISTGLVINAEGNNIGSITADSLIINEDGEIVGGVIPQGIAIGTDNRLLGKINSDGIVRSMTGKPMGKALPNGLVVNEEYQIVGSILFPGLVYSENGTTIGRVTGAGVYVSLDGAELGYISANGYAYRKSGDEYVLDGRLISLKMVVSLEGRFIGSIAPSGKAINFEGNEIGNVHANEYVYGKDGEIIGRIVRPSYAFDMDGNYIGTVTYNGVVLNGDKEVGVYRADGYIATKQNEVIGFAVPMSATANDNSGNYLGRIVPKGFIVRGTEIVGHVGARGYVYDKNNDKIGEIITTGPVFDVLGNLAGQSMSNGAYISVKGSVAGKMKGRYAFDGNGIMVGGVSNNMLAFSDTNKPFGVSSISSSVVVGSEKRKISPFGYVLSSENKVNGSSWQIQPIYGQEGLVYTYVTPNGILSRQMENTALGMGGILFGDKGFIGGIVDDIYALNFKSENIGYKSSLNTILNAKGDIDYKIIPGGYVVQNNGKIQQNLTPIRGFSGSNVVAVNTSGDIIGYADSEGKITDLNGNIGGKVLYDGFVSDNNNSVIGKLLPFTPVINDKCSPVGVTNGEGEVVNNRGVVVGRLLPNGQAVSDVGTYIGYAVFGEGLIDFDGNYAGTVSIGRGVDAKNQAIGCINRHNVIINNDNKWQYGVITPAPVIDFDNNIIAHVMANGSVVSEENQVLGYMQPNGNVVSKSKKDLGNVMRYRVAFKYDNTYLGMIQPSGQVIDNSGVTVGSVNFDGSIHRDGEEIGYALYDWYVYDENFVLYGYVTKDGTVLNLTGSKLGKMDRGFVVSKNKEVVARGNRDYTIRDVSNNVLGELGMDGTVVNYDNQNIGYLSESGVIRDSNGEEIGKAYPLQYYIVMEEKAPIQKPEDTLDKNRVKINEEVEVTTEPEPEVKPIETKPTIKDNITPGHYTGKIVGIAISPEGDILGNILDNNKVVDDNGNVIGYTTPEKVVYDPSNNPIGLAESLNTRPDIYIPVGAGGPGEAYGTGRIPANLGPGGGYGQGERYDPARASALAQLQDERRGNISVGKIQSNIKVSNVTGYEEDGWPDVEQNISSWRVDMSEMILEDKPIPAVLARSVYASEGLGTSIPVTAIVERNVYAEEGRNIIIPAGSRVIGDLGGESGGDSTGGNSGSAVKIGIQWKRLIRPDGSQFNLSNAQTADAQGRAGATGYLDQQLLKKYMQPLMLTSVESMSAYLIAAGDGTTNSDSGSTTDGKTQAANDARESFIEKMDEMLQEIIESKTKIKSVVYIPVGTRIIIFPQQDLWLNNEKRSDKAEAQGGGTPDGDGLLRSDVEKDNNGGSRGGGSNRKVYSPDDENIAPEGEEESGGLLTETPDEERSGRRRFKNRRSGIPPSIDQRRGGQPSEDEIPDLM